MSKTSEIRKTRAESFRVPIDGAVDLRLGDSGEWIRKPATNISMSGMFIRTAEVHPQGTALQVKFEMHNGQPAIQGRAEVLWCRARSAGPDQPRGIGVRFLDLDLESKYAISRLVDRYRQLVRMPFHRPGCEVESGAAPRSTGRRRSALALAFLAGLAAGALGSFWLITGPGRTQRPGAGTVRASEVTPENLRKEEPAPAAAAAPESARAAATPEPQSAFVAGESEEAVGAAVEAWARAWAAKDVERYLGCYASDFQPASGITPEDWQDQRRARLARTGDLQVVVSALEIELTGAGRAIARFDQTYSAPGYQDRVRKSLRLRRRHGEWLIQREEILEELPAS